jgi:hypothetical protein
MTAKLKGLKPDVIIYEGVRQEKLRQFLEGTERPCSSFKIHILEVGYCNDWNRETKLAEKREAYRCLVTRMKKCGWKVDTNRWHWAPGDAYTSTLQIPSSGWE